MDNRPKRFKEIDNPYTLESIEKDKLYFIKFRDEKGEHLVTVTKEVFDVFDESEKEDNKMMVRNSRYIHKYELSDEALNNKMLNNQKSIEDKLISDFEIHELYEAINEFEQYKEEFESLKKCDKYLKIEISLHESEAEIEAFRKYYNDIITDYNKMVRSFPTNFVAKVCGYKIRTYYDGKNTEDEITNDFKL